MRQAMLGKSLADLLLQLAQEWTTTAAAIDLAFLGRGNEVPFELDTALTDKDPIYRTPRRSRFDLGL